ALAGADPRGAGIAPVAEASAQRLVLHTDADGDGRIDAASAERVTLAWSAASGGRFVRGIGGQMMAIADGVERDALRFRYFAGDGTERFPPGGGELAAVDRLAIRRIVIEIAVTGRI